MVDILITGGAGVVGRSLCAEFAKSGLSVRVLTLPGDPNAFKLPKSVEVFYGDVTKPGSLSKAFEDVHTVCHLAAVILAKDRSSFEKINYQGTANVIDACKNTGVKRLLYVSSISVTYPVLTDYGQSKLKGEALVKNSGIPFSIVRPTLVVEKTGGAEYMLLVNYLKRTPFVFLPGGGTCLKRPVKTSDLVKGIALAATSEKALGNTYALAGSRVLSLAEMSRLTLLRMGKEKQILNIPLWFCSFASTLKQIFIPGSVSAKQALAGFRYDASPEIVDAAKDLGYLPGTPFDVRND
ncbi:MAG: NAD-dependent epimerase/dehydratase family protein [Fibrobacteraceae bacterium]|nr:NAD-dependent epimerase/dehydratase family protein [Fibrobacteraceae bacterium]